MTPEESAFRERIAQIAEMDVTPTERMELQFVAIVDHYNETSGIIAEAVQAERQRCMAAVCEGCRLGLDVDQAGDRHLNEAGGVHSWCNAWPIRDLEASDEA